MDIGADDNEEFTVTTSTIWNGIMMTWIKKKCEKHAIIVINNLYSWILREHGEEVLKTFTLSAESEEKYLGQKHSYG